MQLNKTKIQIKMAKECLNVNDLCKKSKIEKHTVYRIMNGSNCKPATVGKIAKALNCDVLELLED
ncbi:helix-turn-helix domain-containing protein [Anaerotignum sp.]|uniref:helix-turn-helix domain-containing protein n=1 Tax=Anaerotignum sp. TaxID=2039241 RepID=UPI002898CAB0|nr:helix-turn-helix transcriptional regulator [Anaerotignum sp.]